MTRRNKIPRPTTVEAYQDLMLRFIKSLTLCDHVGDMGNAIEEVFGIIGVDLEVSDLHLLFTELDAQGIKTLHGN